MDLRAGRSRLLAAALAATGLAGLTGCAVLPAPMAQLNDVFSFTCDLGSAQNASDCSTKASAAQCLNSKYENFGCTGLECTKVPVYSNNLYTIFTSCNEKEAPVKTVKGGTITDSSLAPTGASLASEPGLASPSITEFHVPTPSAKPGAIIAGPDGNVWFTENDAGNAASITPNGAITEQHVGVDTNVVSGIAVDSKGRICVASILRQFNGQAEADDIECFSPTRGSSYQLAIVDAKTAGLVNGPDGYLWYTQAGTNGLGRLNLDTFLTEQAQIFQTGAADPNKVDAPSAIITGPGGSLWFSEVLGNRIGMVTIGESSNGLTLFDLPGAGSGPAGVAAGPDGAIWFAEFNANQIGRITSNGALTEYTVPTANSQPLGIASGPDGALWFTEFNANRIGRISTSGQITEYSIPTPSSGPAGIVTGGDGNVWFTELLGNKIGKLVPPAPAGCVKPGRGACIEPLPAPPVAPIDTRPR